MSDYFKFPTEHDEDFAWAAGLFEGEGCITTFTCRGRVRKDGTGGDRRYVYPRLALSLTDEDVLERFVGIVGGRIRGPYQKGPDGRRPLFHWAANGPHARRLAARLKPHLGERRLARLEEVFGADI